MKDSFGRKIDYLRLAVTDKCNLRCRYCMPEEGIDFSKQTDLMSLEEIKRLAVVFADQGVRKVRLTGGEPFMRKDIMQIFEVLTESFDHINLTTNASLIDPYLPELKTFPIGSINLSLDSLDRENFFRITKRDQFDKILATLFNLIDEGFRMKINAVVMRGINDHEINDFVELTRENKLDVRFIEAMPFNDYDGNHDQFIPFDKIYDGIKLKFPELHQVESDRNASSLKYEIPGFVGNIGIIPAYSRTLCGQCNRIRMTPKGKMMTCLYSGDGVDLLKLMREGISDEDLTKTITSHVMNKEENGFIAEASRDSSNSFQSMTTIGG